MTSRRQHRKFPEPKIVRPNGKTRRVHMGKRPDRAAERRLDAAARHRLSKRGSHHADTTVANLGAMGVLS